MAIQEAYKDRLRHSASSLLRRIKRNHPSPGVRQLAYGILINRQTTKRG